MKKITFLIALLSISLSFGQNLIVNGDFETGSPGDPVPDWGGFKNRIANDDIITPDKVGQVENGDGSLFQEVSVTPGETYNVTFDYRWLGSGGATGSALTVRVKEVGNLANNLDLIGGTTSNGYTLNTTVDQWFNGSFSVLIPSGITGVRLLFFKPNDNKPINLNDVSIELDPTASLDDLKLFNFTAYPNPTKDVINIAASQTIDAIEIYSILGQQVLKEQINKNKSQINISSLSQGVYIVKAYVGDTSGTYRFIKE